MKAADLLDMIGNVDDSIIEEAYRRKKPVIPHLIKLVAAVACLCLVVVASFDTMKRFDYFEGSGCNATPGTIVNDYYYYKVEHSGVWRYSEGKNEKVLNTYWEDGGWLVNQYGLFYSCGKKIYRMNLDTLERDKIFSTKEGTHIDFELTNEGNVIVTIYDKNKKNSYQLLVDGKEGGVIEQLTEKNSYNSDTPMYTMLNYELGTRKLTLVQAGEDEINPHYMLMENGVSLLPEGYWVSNYGYKQAEGVISFEVYKEGQKTTEETEMLTLFEDGKTILEPTYCNYNGAIGHMLLYVDDENTENYGSNGTGIWCYDTDTGERWQLKLDSECEFYAFTNNDKMLFSCVPWSKKQTAWKIVYEGNKPVSLQLIDNNIIE